MKNDIITLIILLSTSAYSSADSERNDDSIFNANAVFNEDSLVIAEAKTSPKRSPPVTLNNLLLDFVSNIEEQFEPEIAPGEPIGNNSAEKNSTPEMLARPPASTTPKIFSARQEAIIIEHTKYFNEFQMGINHLLRTNWTRNKKPVPYLPSTTTKCTTQKDRIICLSTVIEESRPARIIKYRAKSIISPIDKGIFKIVYRNLVLDSMNDKALKVIDSLDDGIGSSPQAHKFQTKPGWTKPHTMECHFTSNETMRCLKNLTHYIGIRAATK